MFSSESEAIEQKNGKDINFEKIVINCVPNIRKKSYVSFLYDIKNLGPYFLNWELKRHHFYKARLTIYLSKTFKTSTQVGKFCPKLGKITGSGL